MKSSLLEQLPTGRRYLTRGGRTFRGLGLRGLYVTARWVWASTDNPVLTDTCRHTLDVNPTLIARRLLLTVLRITDACLKPPNETV